MSRPKARSSVLEPVALAAAPHLERGGSLSSLLEALLDAMIGSLRADRGTLYLVDGARRTLTSFVAHLPEVPRIELDFGQGIAGTVAAEGAPLRIADPSSDVRFDQSFDEKTGYRTRSLLCVPIVDSRGEVIGVLQVLNKADGAFSDDDEAYALSLAAEAGRVLEHTSLYASLKARSSLPDKRPGLAFRFNAIVGESEAMREVYALVDKAAGTEATVLVWGETGTGKELIARAVHHNSPRATGPFVKVDCTTLPESLFENELFGHEKGAFTGADRNRPGKIEAASGGTLFLDEVGELPLAVQAKLLRVLQDREYTRVGGTAVVEADVRFVCATHRDLLAMVDEGTFREDLYYRLRVVPLRLPPLRERGEADRMRLVEHFVDRFARRHNRPVRRVTDAAWRRIAEHPYPGNIRELEHSIESAVVLCDDGVIDVDDLALPERRATGRDRGPQVGDPDRSLAEIERAHIEGVLAAVDGNQSEAARRLGIGRNTLARKLAPS